MKKSKCLRFDALLAIKTSIDQKFYVSKMADINPAKVNNRSCCDDSMSECDYDY